LDRSFEVKPAFISVSAYMNLLVACVPTVQKKSYVAVLRFLASIALWVGGVVLLLTAVMKVAGSRGQIVYAALGAGAILTALLIWAFKED